MKKISLVLFVSMIALQVWAQKNPMISSVQFKIKLKADAQIEQGSSVDQLNKRFAVTAVESLFPQSDKFAARHRKHGLQLWYLLTVDSVSTEKMKQIIATYQTDPNIALAEPVVLQVFSDPIQKSKPVKSVKRGDNSNFPNDNLFSQQWSLKNTTTPRADIDIRRAWTIQKGDPSVIVAVIDCGVDCKHPDLINTLWKNTAEANGTAGVDDDDNGFVDDIHGWNFTEDTCYIEPIEHGTHVAGIIAATTNNSIGIAGIAGGDGTGNGARIMSCQVFGDGIFDSRGGHERAFIYAADNGAVIAQNSWSSNVASDYGQSVLDAIDYFIKNAGYDANGNPTGPMQGGLVMFSAGNESQNALFYPGCYNNVLAVAASESSDKIASYSNYGTWVDVTAPGSDILSPVQNNQYKLLSGTSMACPQVSGLAALIVSQFKNTGITPQQVRNRILGMADYIDDKNPQYKHKLGAGRINAYKSLLPASNVPPTAISDLRSIESLQLSARIVWTTPTATIQDTINTVSEYECRYSTEPITAENFDKATAFEMFKPLRKQVLDTVTITGLKAETQYYVAIRTIDAFSNKSALSNLATFRTLRAPKAVLSHTELNLTMRPNRDTVIEISITNAGIDTLLIHPYYQNKTTISQQILHPTVEVADQQPIVYVLNDKDSANEKIVTMNAINGKIYSRLAFKVYNPEGAMLPMAYDGNFLYVGKCTFSKTGIIYVYNKQLQLIDSIPTPRMKIFNSLAVSNGKLYLLDNFKAYFFEIDIRTKRVVRKIDHSMEYAWAVAIDQKQNTAFVTHSEMRTIDMRTSKMTGIYSCEPLSHVSYSNPMNLLFATMAYKNFMAAIDPITRKELFTVPFNEEGTIGVQAQNSVTEWLQESHTDTIIAPGKTHKLRLTINTSRMNAGLYSDFISLSSNDPSLTAIDIPVQLNITPLPENGQAQLSLSCDTVTFYRHKGKLSDSALVTISNTGSATLKIGGMACLDSSFSLRKGVVNINAGGSEQVWIKRETTSNDDFTTKLVIRSNTPQDAYKQVVVRCKTAPEYFVVSGKINDLPSDGITLNISGDTTFTSSISADGVINLQIHPLQNITITPVKQGYTFTPASRSISAIQANVSDLSFVATPLVVINEVNEAVETDITVFPNPTKDKLSIGGLKNADMLEIVNLNGVVVVKKKIMSNTITIDMHDVSTGVYCLKIFSNGKITEHKIIKE